MPALIERSEDIVANKPNMTLQKRYGLIGLALIAPTVLILSAVIVYPLISAIYLSFFSIYTPTLKGAFVGIDNYVELLGSSYFWFALWTTILWTAGTLVLQVIFGVGMALLGYCPGTGVAALGDGSRHAWFGVLGMLVGGAAYAHFYPAIESHILSVGTYGKQTLPTLTGVSPWWYVAGVAVLAVVVFVLIEKFGPRTRMPHAG